MTSSDSRLWITQREVPLRDLQFQVSSDSSPKRYRVVHRRRVIFETTSVVDAATRFSDLRDGRTPGRDCLYPDCTSLFLNSDSEDHLNLASMSRPTRPGSSLLTTPGCDPSAPEVRVDDEQSPSSSVAEPQEPPLLLESDAKPKARSFFARLFQPFVKPKYLGNCSSPQVKVFPKGSPKSQQSQKCVAKMPVPEEVPVISKPSPPVVAQPEKSRRPRPRPRPRLPRKRQRSASSNSDVSAEGSIAWKYREEVLLCRDAIDGYSAELDAFRVKILEGDELEVLSFLRKFRQSERSIRTQLDGFSKTFEVGRLGELFERLKEKREILVSSEEVQRWIRSWKSRRHQSRTQERAGRWRSNIRSTGCSTAPRQQLRMQEARELPPGVRLHVMTSAEVERLIEKETREEFESVQQEYQECLDLVTDMQAMVRHTPTRIDTIEDHVQQASGRIERGRTNIRPALGMRKKSSGWLVSLFRK